MADIGISARLRRIEKCQNGVLSEIRKLILAGKYFDELTEEQQQKYLEYSESLGGASVEYASAYLDNLLNNTPREQAFHFRLVERKRPPTPEEHKRNVEEVQRYFEECIEEYNKEK